MTNVQINAQIECTDGPCGKSTKVIVNPVSHNLTHGVIEGKSLPDNPPRLVPVFNVAGTTQDRITLNCTDTELANMPPFIITSFIPECASGMAYESGAAFTFPYVINDTACDPVKQKNNPPGELAVYSGMQIEAGDSKVGRLDKLVLDPQSGENTHLLMREGNMWGNKDTAIPASAVYFADSKYVYLKLDKTAVKDLPALPVK